MKDTNIMYWYLFFVLFVMALTLPIKTKIVAKSNILNLSSQLSIEVFKLKILKLKIKFRGNYVYVTKGKYTYKEKLTPSNINVVFAINFIKLIYFRLQLLELIEESEIGYMNNALGTSLMVAGTDIITKGILSRIKNNKKSSHIFIDNYAKYDQDCLNFKLEISSCINLLDVIYSFVSSKIKSKGERYERTKQREQQSESID